MNNAEQLNAHIRNLSKASGVSPQALLRYYMMENLLERISLSKYRPHIILKGGMLIASMTGLALRTTIDIDAMVDKISVSIDSIKTIFEEIVNIDNGSGVSMTLTDIREIREDTEYTGYRISIKASFGRIVQSFKIDISVGDIVVPAAVEHDFTLLFDRGKIVILAYRIETVLAEKIETIISRGVANTRMRDFYDIYLLTKLYGDKIDKFELKKVLLAISGRRGSVDVFKDVIKILNSVKISPEMAALWNNYSHKNSYTQNVEWSVVAATTDTFISDILA